MRMRCEVLVTVLAAACGGSSPMSAAAGGGGGGNPAAASVTMSEYKFSPETVRVAVGSAVAWNNNGTTSHTSTSDTTGIWNSNAINPPGPPPPSCPYPPCDGTPGGSFQYTFSTAGTYPYHCAFHETLGMKGVVIVTP
jgi:plastocyanin